MSKKQEKIESNLMPNTQALPTHSPPRSFPYHQGEQPVMMDPPILPSTSRKRNRVSGGNTGAANPSASNTMSGGGGQRGAVAAGPSHQGGGVFGTDLAEGSMASSPQQQQPPVKKSRTNTPWSPAEEQRLKSMRDAQNSWAEIAKTFPTRTEGSVKKHWYKDMHYAEFAEDESAALLNAIKDYETNKWKVIGQKVGKPAKGLSAVDDKACEQYAKEHFANRM